jgi:hypothetical protein
MSFCRGESASFNKFRALFNNSGAAPSKYLAKSGFASDRYALARRNFKNCLPSPEFVLFRKKKNRAGTLCTKVDQFFGNEAVVAGLLDGSRRLHSFDSLQTINPGTASGDRRDTRP